MFLLNYGLAFTISLSVFYGVFHYFSNAECSKEIFDAAFQLSTQSLTSRTNRQFHHKKCRQQLTIQINKNSRIIYGKGEKKMDLELREIRYE